MKRVFLYSVINNDNDNESVGNETIEKYWCFCLVIGIDRNF
jgi:hypothetical protein